jgi:hypothetical protein
MDDAAARPAQTSSAGCVGGVSAIVSAPFSASFLGGWGLSADLIDLAV